MDLLERIQGAFTEAGAVTRAAVTYLIGLEDPHDEDLIELIECRHPDSVPCRLTPVFLVHGFTHNWSGWLPLLVELRNAGFHRFVRFNYESIFDPPAEIAGALGARIAEVQARLDCDRIHGVGHSLGGTVLRSWVVLADGDDEIGGVVTLGTPHKGSPWAYFPVLPRGVSILRPGSQELAILNGADDDRSHWTTIAGDTDVLVPPGFAHLDGAEQQTFPGLGHVGLLYDDDVLAATVDALVDRD